MDEDRVQLIGRESGPAVFLLGCVWGFRIAFTDAQGRARFSLRCRRVVGSRAVVDGADGVEVGRVVSVRRRAGYVLRAGHTLVSEVRNLDLPEGRLEVVRDGTVLASASRARQAVALTRSSLVEQQAFTTIEFQPCASALERLLSLAAAFLVSFDHADRRWR